MSARVGVSGNVYVYVFKENIVDELELLRKIYAMQRAKSEKLTGFSH